MGWGKKSPSLTPRPTPTDKPPPWLTPDVFCEGEDLEFTYKGLDTTGGWGITHMYLMGGVGGKKETGN